jgi:hypothetical protein
MVRRHVKTYLARLLTVLLLWTPCLGRCEAAPIKLDAFTRESNALSIPTYSITKNSALLLPTDSTSENLQLYFVPLASELPEQVPLGSSITFEKNSKRQATDPTTFTLGLDMGTGAPTTLVVTPIADLFKSESSELGTILSSNSTRPKGTKTTDIVLVLAKQPGVKEVKNLFVVRQAQTQNQNALCVGAQPVLPINFADKSSYPQMADALANTKLQNQLTQVFTLATTSSGTGTSKGSNDGNLQTAVKTVNSLLEEDTIATTLRPLIEGYLSDAQTLAAQTTKDLSALMKLERKAQVLNQWILTGRVLAGPTSSDAAKGSHQDSASSGNIGITGGQTSRISSGGTSPSTLPNSLSGTAPGGGRASGSGTTTTGGQSSTNPQPPSSGGSNSKPTGGGSQQSGGGTRTGGSPSGGGYPAEPACPNFGLAVKKINGQPGDPVRSVTLSWKSALSTYDYKVRFLERTTKSTYIFPFAGTMVDYTTAPLPTGIYDVWVSERSRSGGVYKEQCTPTEVKFPFECPAFREPGVVKKSSGEIETSNLRDSGTLWIELVSLKSGAKLPNLDANEQGVFQNPQSKACYEASKYGTMSSPLSPFGARVKKDGRFSTNDPMLMHPPSSGGALLVCLYLCPSCVPQATLEGRPDAFIRAFMWQGNTEGDNSSLSAFSPASNAQISNTLRPTIAFNPSRDATGYEVAIRNSSNNAIVAQSKVLTTPEFTPVDRLAPGQYTAATRTFFKGIGGNFTAPVPFTISIPTLVTLNPRGDVEGLKPTLRWQASEHADATYEVRIDEITSTPKTLFTQTGLTSTSFETPGTLAPGKKYAWFVRPKVGPYFGDWGEGESFTVPSQITTLVAPLKETAGLQPFLFWSPIPVGVKDTVAYQIQGDYVRGQTVIGSAFNGATKDTLFQPTKELRSGSTLQIKIRAIVNGNPLAWGKAVTLQVTKGRG